MTNQFLVYRHGSNSANQSMQESKVVAIVYDATDENEALERVQAYEPADPFTAITVYANQTLEAVRSELDRVTDEEWDAAQEDEYLPKL
jgi:hypothetical protein